MAGRKRRDIPASLTRGRGRFEAWRRTREVGTRIPDRLWSLAVKLVDAHGVSRTASTLGLDDHALKRRVAAKSVDSPAAAGAFIEVCPPSLAAAGECVVEVEDGSGASMRVHLRGCDTPDLVALCRGFRSGK